MDFSALRAQTLGSGLDEEAVTVNTRALIDKVLARYSGEWTVLRELLQNAADAGATKVTVKFETLPSADVALPQIITPSNLLKHTIQHHTLQRLVVTNNGQAFSENDWMRLKRIAEGNPDETKIGAFGVGFYSVFADCEEPFISSGREAMAFFWKSNSLFTRRLKLPDTETSMETNFVLDYRDKTSAVPVLQPLAQFLANSLTFVGIQDIELWIDEYNVLDLHKKTSPSLDVPIPKDVEPKTSEGLMKITAVTKEMAQIDGSWMPIIGWKRPQIKVGRAFDVDEGPSLRRFFSRLAGGVIQDDNQAAQKFRAEVEPQDVVTKVKATVFLSVDTATIRTFTNSNFNSELERATKKPPPKATRLAILTAPYIENDLIAETASAGDVFGTVLPTRSGRIFIGFPTHQTTGLSAHISAPSVIPTVERESIDLNARYVRTWNMEMLRAAGILCRIAWASEMVSLRGKITAAAGARAKFRIEDVTPFLKEAVATTQNFTFRESTPSAKTGQLLEDAFWTSSKKPSIDVISTCGVLPTHQVRIAPKDLSFVEGVPVLPESLVSGAKAFVDRLVDYGLVTEVTVSDIRTALESTPLNSKQVTEFLDWLTKQASNRRLDEKSITNLLSVAVANYDGEGEQPGSLLVFGQVKYFHNPSRIPVDMPVPSTVIPFKFTRGFSKHDLELLGWEEYQIVPWIKWLLAESKNREVLSESQDITRSPSFSALIFPLLSKQWEAMSQSSKGSVIDLLSSQTVIPTKLGMRKPCDAYFPHVKLFDDLPTIQGLGNVKDKVLVAFGVRKTVELGVVFDRLLSPGQKPEAADPVSGSHVALIQYLASVKDDIPTADVHRLRNTPICPREDQHAAAKESIQRFKVSDLFEPRPQLRDLGLPILAWPGPYRSNSAEGRFMSLLGLRTKPSASEMVDIMARAGTMQDLALRDKALTYFISNHHVNGYGNFDYSKLTVPFLPLEGKPQLSVPGECFVDEGSALLGFSVLKRELQSHAPFFGVKRHPPIDQCISILAKQPPRNHAMARQIFTYFATRLGEINGSNISLLQDLNFVPIFPNDQGKAAPKDFTSPRNCFLGDSDTFGQIFNFVDFGQEANTFLLKCGSKPEPSKVEIAQLLVREPARISSTFRDPDKYMALLRSLADSLTVLKKNKDLFREMKRAPFLLASKDIPQTQPTAGKTNNGDNEDAFEEDDAQGIREWQLTSAENAIIIDDYINFNLFKASILAAPQEESLEDFYYALGSPMLSSLVEEAARHGPRSADQRAAQKLQKQIMERSTLFLHEQSADIIKHDAKWLEKNLSVQLVSSISLRRSLKGRDLSHVEKRTAVITQANREYTLWIVGERPDLYQVSQALVHVLLTRPKLHSALTLEMLLKTDLLELRARGFNVGRILRQKAAEARLAESKRQEALEEERRRIEEQDKNWKESQKKMAASQNGLPGGFPESPDSKVSTTRSGTTRVAGGEEDEDALVKSAQKWSSNLVRQLGFGRQPRPQPSSAGIPQPQLQTTEGSAEPPPPYSESSSVATGTGGGVGTVTAPHQLRENLLSAIKKTRPHNASGLFSRGGQNTVSETKSYCDEKPAHDLQFIAEMKHGIQMFLPNAPGTNHQTSSAFLSANSSGLTLFADTLKLVGDIFSISSRSINIFHEIGGKTIAFNRSGSIFCNYLYFKQLHETQMMAGQDGAEGEAVVYWWVIFCHELAHNLVEDHSSDHSYYTEGFVAQYFAKVMQKVQERNLINNPNNASRRLIEA